MPEQIEDLFRDAMEIKNIDIGLSNWWVSDYFCLRRRSICDAEHCLMRG